MLLVYEWMKNLQRDKQIMIVINVHEQFVSHHQKDKVAEKVGNRRNAKKKGFTKWHLQPSWCTKGWS